MSPGVKCSELSSIENVYFLSELCLNTCFSPRSLTVCPPVTRLMGRLQSNQSWKCHFLLEELLSDGQSTINICNVRPCTDCLPWWLGPLVGGWRCFGAASGELGVPFPARGCPVGIPPTLSAWTLSLSLWGCWCNRSPVIVRSLLCSMSVLFQFPIRVCWFWTWHRPC